MFYSYHGTRSHYYLFHRDISLPFIRSSVHDDNRVKLHRCNFSRWHAKRKKETVLVCLRLCDQSATIQGGSRRRGSNRIKYGVIERRTMVRHTRWCVSLGYYISRPWMVKSLSAVRCREKRTHSLHSLHFAISRTTSRGYKGAGQFSQQQQQPQGANFDAYICARGVSLVFTKRIIEGRMSSLVHAYIRLYPYISTVYPVSVSLSRETVYLHTRLYYIAVMRERRKLPSPFDIHTRLRIPSFPLADGASTFYTASVKETCRDIRPIEPLYWRMAALYPIVSRVPEIIYYLRLFCNVCLCKSEEKERRKKRRRKNERECFTMPRKTCDASKSRRYLLVHVRERAASRNCIYSYRAREKNRE